MDRVAAGEEDGVGHRRVFVLIGLVMPRAPFAALAVDLATLSASSVNENSANNAVVGALSSTDPDSSLGDTATYSLVGDGAGGRFAVSAANLVVANGSLLDFENSASHQVTVRVGDVHGAHFDKLLTINIANINEAPSGSGKTVTTNTDIAYVFTAADFGFSDSDGNAPDGDQPFGSSCIGENHRRVLPSQGDVPKRKFP